MGRLFEISSARAEFLVIVVIVVIVVVLMFPFHVCFALLFVGKMFELSLFIKYIVYIFGICAIDV